MTKEVPRTSVLRDEELIAYLRLQGLDKDIAAATRIEELIAERDALFRRATLAEEWRDHDKTRADEAEAKLEKIERIIVKRIKFHQACKDAAGSGSAKQREHHRVHALSEVLGEIRKSSLGAVGSDC